MQTTKRMPVTKTFVISDQYGVTAIFNDTKDHAGTWRNSRYEGYSSYYTYHVSFTIAGCIVRIEADTPLQLYNARKAVEADVMANGPETFWERTCYHVKNNTAILETPFIHVTHDRLINAGVL